jgi:hypothetical protein
MLGFESRDTVVKRVVREGVVVDVVGSPFIWLWGDCDIKQNTKQTQGELKGKLRLMFWEGDTLIITLFKFPSFWNNLERTSVWLWLWLCVCVCVIVCVCVW